ncbi:DUF5641 domain-containing protein [Trichonephila inaurata madagascariensis]|uniref:DUF5641 domain-containing protein n=1 Tax=Trichonephila inaurata madagascariensis TaxID=2747483 RepID=A0A8X6Y7V6_9ARAC|nr:DUF5641 domain-containing protein [Trichonephila inaurata madagascariensis]
MEFQQVCHSSIPRWLQITNKQVTFHGFSDASEAAFACVVDAVQRNRETTEVRCWAEKANSLLSSVSKKRSRVGEEIKGPPERVEESKLTLKGRWDIVQILKLIFWKRWQIDYLNSIQGRTKWKNGTSNIKIGDVVIIKENNLLPSVWPLGKFISTHPGKDGIVRVVTLKTKKGLYQRPIVKLCMLPVHQE